MITIDLDKAKRIHADRLREQRAPLLAALDVAFQRALETHAHTTRIVSKKQALRDITKKVELAGSLDELRGITLDGGR